ncbi:MAG: hypothetical protein LC107_03570 [Chitinophagales bacterium]|nr:hypothetical protein [Chitinophagales bacterium]
MKNLFFILAVILTAQTVSLGQTPSEKSWTLIHERFATWCPYCGTWGWDLKENMLEEFKNDNVIFMSVDYSGDLTNPIAKEFDENFGGVGQPIFYVDGVNIAANASNGATKVAETRLEVDFKKDLPPFAALGLDATLNEETKTIDVKALVKYVQEVESGDYLLGLYLLEDVWANQASRTGLQLHKNVLVGSFLPNVFNNPIVSGKVNEGTEFNFSASLDNLSGKSTDYKVLGVIWTFNKKYLFHNGFITDVKLASSTKDVDTSNFNAYQDESGNIVVILDQDTDITNITEMMISDISGTIIKKISKNDINSKVLQISTNYVPGIHIITLNNGGIKTSKKVVLY